MYSTKTAITMSLKDLLDKVDDYTITGFTHNGDFGDIKVIVDDNVYN